MGGKGLGQLVDIVCPFLSGYIADVVGLCAQQLVEQDVSCGVFGFGAVMDQNAAQPRAGAGRGGQGTQIRLQRPGGNQSVPALCGRLSHNKFQTAQLVSAGAEACEIVPLDVQSVIAKLPLQIMQPHQRRGQAGELRPRHLLEGCFQILFDTTISHSVFLVHLCYMFKQAACQLCSRRKIISPEAVFAPKIRVSGA